MNRPLHVQRTGIQEFNPGLYACSLSGNLPGTGLWSRVTLSLREKWTEPAHRENLVVPNGVLTACVAFSARPSEIFKTYMGNLHPLFKDATCFYSRFGYSNDWERPMPFTQSLNKKKTSTSNKANE